MKRFQITSGSLVCSDPCYTTDVWCMGIVDNVMKGTWIAEVEHGNFGGWGERIAELTICHESRYPGYGKWEELPGSFGVDSGQFGFFDNEHYRKADSVKTMKKYDFGGDYLTDESDPDGEEWYHACCELTLGPESWGVLPNGVVSSSGFGDGSYGVYGLKNDQGEYVAFQVVFIETEEEDDLDGWGDENQDEF